MTTGRPAGAVRPPAQIETLTVRHFKAINGTLEFKLGRRNVVILGENGSGKTSLTRALTAVLDAARPGGTQTARAELFQRCIDANPATAAGYIQLDVVVGALDAPRGALIRQRLTLHEDGRCEAGPGAVGSTLPSTTLVEAAKAKRILDYKGLLRTYFLTGATVDLFDLLITDVLPDDLNPITGMAFGEEWTEMERLHGQDRRRGSVARDLTALIENLNNGLAVKLGSLALRAQPLLQTFDPNLSFDIAFGPLVPAPRNKPAPRGYAHLQVRRDGQLIAGHTEFLNEARLSAVALCLHFAALLEAPRTSLNVLVLDDVLIGLDMENRKPTLDLLDRHFADWQTIMFTYDPEWFDIVRLWSVSRNWECLKLHRSGDAEHGSTLVDKAQGLLEEAIEHARRGDYSPAANAARSALENTLKRYFEREKVELIFKRKPKDLMANDFWQRATRLTGPAGRLLIDAAVQRDVEGARSVILNPLSHDPTNPLSGREVQAAINAVRVLAAFLSVANP